MDTLATSPPPQAGAPEKKQLPARQRVVLISAGALLVVGIIWGIHWWLVGRFIQSTDDAYLQADSVTVAPKVSGYVTEVYVADNQAVTPGQELVRLDGRQYQAILEQATAAIAARKADIERGNAQLLE